MMRGLLLIDLKDLRAMLKFVAENAKAFNWNMAMFPLPVWARFNVHCWRWKMRARQVYLVSRLLNLEDWLQTRDGRGVINVLNAEKLINSPKMYSAFIVAHGRII